MKTFFLVFISCFGVFLHGCGEPLTDSRCVLRFPQLPQAWESLLGSPLWRIEWQNDQGRREVMVVRGDEKPAISLPQTWTSAVSAWPFWPDKGLVPGIFMPAGAIFPFDASGKSLRLSWQGGVDANLFWEFAQASDKAGQEPAGQESVPPEPEPETEAVERAAARLPWNFDWPRFRELFDDPSLNADIRADPWLADWQSIAEKIVQSGFDKRRLVPEARSSLAIPVQPGPWIGTSPFAPPLLFEAAPEEAGQTVPVFPVRPTADTWVCADGILRCNTETWIFMAY